MDEDNDGVHVNGKLCARTVHAPTRRLYQNYSYLKLGSHGPFPSAPDVRPDEILANLGVAHVPKSRPDFSRILTPVIQRFC
jgi:hypothetical protein